MFSITRSRLALPVQVLFLALNGLGLLFGTIFNVGTPDLYENNAHHRIGWVATWVMTAQFVMGLLLLYARRSKKDAAVAAECAAFLPVSVEAIVRHDQIHNTQADSVYRWSGDSGQGTEHASSPSHSRDRSLNDERQGKHPEYTKPEADDEDDGEYDGGAARRRLWRNPLVDKILSQSVPDLSSKRLLRVMEAAYIGIDRTILILGFIAIVTGGVTYAGIFVRCHRP